ncbi:MAG: FAD-dependent oxidoreductase [Pyrinomonadaceae bacterium]
MSEKNIAVAKFSELKNGEMKEVSVDGTSVLLARVGEECYAVGANCPHYGAPLAEGILSGTRIVCPWHHACFDVTTGNFEEPPAFDSLSKFDVKVEDDEIFVRIPDDEQEPGTQEVTANSTEDPRIFAIIGGGAAGFMAAQTLREDGFSGRIVMITLDSRTPYDRPNLSKDYLHGHAEPAWMPLRSDDFYAEHDIEIMYRSKVTRVDAPSKTIFLEDGSKLQFDSLLIATGGLPRKLTFHNSDLKNVFYLRSFSDADAIIAAAEAGKRAVVIGSSFIGMEAACSLRLRGCEVTVVAPDEVPFAKTLGPEIGKLFQQLHQEHGVKFRLGEHVEGFNGEIMVESVVLENGEQIPADLVLVGIGVKPATEFLSGIELHKDGGLIADEHLQIAEDIYAAGDVTHFPDVRTGELTRIEHWRTAMQQGRTAGHNMAGKRRAFTAVPFFWTTQFDTTLNYVGHVRDWDKVIFDGRVDDMDFLAFYVKDFKVLAVAGMNRDKQMAYFEELIRMNRMPGPDKLPIDAETAAKITHEAAKLPAVAL